MNWTASTFHDAMDDWSANVEKCESDFESLSLSFFLYFFLSKIFRLPFLSILLLILGSRNLHPSLSFSALLLLKHPHPLHSNFTYFPSLFLSVCLWLFTYDDSFLQTSLHFIPHPPPLFYRVSLFFFFFFLLLFICVSVFVPLCECLFITCHLLSLLSWTLIESKSFPLL